MSARTNTNNPCLTDCPHYGVKSNVDEADGYAIVVKAGSSISKFGTLIVDGDYIEKSLYDEYEERGVRNLIQSGDVLVASTGDGTLGKCCVYRHEHPAVADGHVTIVRVDPTVISPDYLCDYLRVGFGAKQIERLFSGSTGLIELTTEHVNTIVIDLSLDVVAQNALSAQLRQGEVEYSSGIVSLKDNLESAKRKFFEQ